MSIETRLRRVEASQNREEETGRVSAPPVSLSAWKLLFGLIPALDSCGKWYTFADLSALMEMHPAERSVLSCALAYAEYRRWIDREEDGKYRLALCGYDRFVRGLIYQEEQKNGPLPVLEGRAYTPEEQEAMSAPEFLSLARHSLLHHNTAYALALHAAEEGDIPAGCTYAPEDIWREYMNWITQRVCYEFPAYHTDENAQSRFRLRLLAPLEAFRERFGLPEIARGAMLQEAIEAYQQEKRL